MSTISGVSGGRTGWQDVSNSTRGTDRRDRMFARTDTDGDGSVDGAELQSMLDKMAQRSGSTAANADSVLKTMDSDGNGSLDAGELDAGMKSLMPTPASTMAFAQQRSDDGPRGIDGPPPPPPDADGTASSGGTGSSDSADGLQSLLSNLFQAADTDGNGNLDKTELDTLKTNFDSAIQSLVNGSDSGTATAGTSSTAGSTVASSSSDDSTGSTSSANPDSMMAQLTALADLVLKEYAATAAGSIASSQTAALNLTA